MKKLAGAALLSIGDILGKLVGFLILPYLTTKMGTSEYGVLTLYLSFIQILIILISFSGQGLLPVKYIQENEASSLLFRKDNIHLAFFVSIVIFFFFVFYYVIFNVKMPVWDAFWIIMASLAQAINIINLSHLRISQNYGLSSVGQFSLSALNVIFTVLLFSILDSTASNRLIAVSASFFIVQILYSLFIYSKLNSRILNLPDRTRSCRYKEIVHYGMSLWPHHGSFWIKSSIDRFFLAHYMSVAVVGVYGLAFQLSSVLMLFYSVVNQACQPFIYRYLKDKAFNKVYQIQLFYVLLTLLSCMIYFYLLPFIFPFFFSAKFHDSVKYFNYLLPGTMFMSIYYIFTHALFFYRKNKIISTVTTASMIIHILGVFFVVNTTISVVAFCIVYTLSSAFACIVTAFLCFKQINTAKRNNDD